MQLYNFSQILLQTWAPPASPSVQSDRDKLVHDAADAICGIAVGLMTSSDDDAASVMSSGCVFVAGLHTKDHEKRKVIVSILGRLQYNTGFPILDFRDELQAHWNKTDMS